MLIVGHSQIESGRKAWNFPRRHRLAGEPNTNRSSTTLHGVRLPCVFPRHDDFFRMYSWYQINRRGELSVGGHLVEAKCYKRRDQIKRMGGSWQGEML